MESCAVSSSAGSAAFVYENSGEISDCAVKSTAVSGTGFAAGFIFSHSSGTVNACYASDCTVSGSQSPDLCRITSPRSPTATPFGWASPPRAARRLRLFKLRLPLRLLCGTDDFRRVPCGYTYSTVTITAPRLTLCGRSSGTISRCYVAAAVNASSATAAASAERRHHLLQLRQLRGDLLRDRRGLCRVGHRRDLFLCLRKCFRRGVLRVHDPGQRVELLYDQRPTRRRNWFRADGDHAERLLLDTGQRQKLQYRPLDLIQRRHRRHILRFVEAVLDHHVHRLSL